MREKPFVMGISRRTYIAIDFNLHPAPLHHCTLHIYILNQAFFFFFLLQNTQLAMQNANAWNVIHFACCTLSFSPFYDKFNELRSIFNGKSPLCIIIFYYYSDRRVIWMLCKFVGLTWTCFMLSWTMDWLMVWKFFLFFCIQHSTHQITVRHIQTEQKSSPFQHMMRWTFL